MDADSLEKLIQSILSSSAQSKVATLLQDPENQEILLATKELLSLFGKTAAAKDSDQKLEQALKDAGIEEESIKSLTDLYSKYRETILGKRKAQLEQNLPILTAMNWRMDVELATRDKRRCFTPGMLCSFAFQIPTGNIDKDTSKAEYRNEEILFSAEGGMVKRLGEQMKAASGFSRTITYRKLHRGLPESA